jgi:AcrR family transcriptional regulator
MNRGKYKLKKRAERQEETRQRITEAAVELHQTIGPARTTISMIADKAGVQRHTFYKHFPEEIQLHHACAAHYLALKPPPDPEAWRQITEPETRLRQALAEVYAYYQRTEAMMSNVLRDAQVHPLVQEVCKPLFAHWESMRNILAVGWKDNSEKHAGMLGALALALDFGTWRLLVRQQGLQDDCAVELMVRTVQSAVELSPCAGE